MRSLSPMQLEEDVLEREILDFDLGFGPSALPDVSVQIRVQSLHDRRRGPLVELERSSAFRIASVAGSGARARTCTRTIDSIEVIEVAVPVESIGPSRSRSCSRAARCRTRCATRTRRRARRRPSTSMICSRNRRRAIGSRLATGSSRIKRSGLCPSASRIESFCRWPDRHAPDRWRRSSFPAFVEPPDELIVPARVERRDHADHGPRR